MPVDTGGARHYRGPDAPHSTAPRLPLPLPSLPPAEDLIEPSGLDAPAFTEPMPAASARIVDQIEDAFTAWMEQPEHAHRIAALVPHAGIVFEAFKAGAAWHARSLTDHARAGKAEELEGTVESRTIAAALAFFKEQVLIHNPEEVRTGEWLSACDVDTLITAITANTKGTKR